MIKYLNLFLFVGMIVMNYLANALPINNVTTGQLSDSYPNLFVPAGITFSIWGLIYLLLAGYCVIQFMTTSNQAGAENIGLLFAVTCILNALWIIFWHYKNLPASLIIMTGLLIALVYINIFIRDLPYGIIKASFGIYLGWICIATIANVTALFVNYNWNGFGISEETWTIVMVVTGALIVGTTIYRLQNPFIGISVIWAFAGIIIKRQFDFRSIVIACAIAILCIGIITVWGFIRKVSPELA